MRGMSIVGWIGAGGALFFLPGCGPSEAEKQAPSRAELVAEYQAEVTALEAMEKEFSTASKAWDDAVHTNTELAGNGDFDERQKGMKAIFNQKENAEKRAVAQREKVESARRAAGIGD